MEQMCIRDRLKPESKDLLEYANHFAIGDLDGDKLPEIAVYEQRASADLDDPGTLVLYQIKDGKYQPVTDLSLIHISIVPTNTHAYSEVFLLSSLKTTCRSAASNINMQSFVRPLMML